MSSSGSNLGPSLDIGGTYGTWKIWAVGEGQLWTVNPYGAVVYYDAGSDERNYKQLGELAEYQLEDVWATSPTNAYVCGRTAIFHTTDGENWVNELPASAESVHLNALHGVDENNVYACGAKFYRSNGHGVWSDPEDFQPNPDLLISCLGIWAISPDNIYLATSNGIYHGTPE